MPPRAQTSAARRGRPAKVAAAESALPVAVMVSPSPSKKRGRPAKTDVETAMAEPPKKRGRPTKTQADEPIAQIDSAIKRGRRSLAAAEEAVAEAPVPTKKRAGRPRKDEVVSEAPATPKRRGRPAGSQHVAKRTSPRSKPVARAPTMVAAAPRINPKMRSRLRHRTVPVEKPTKQVAGPVKKARGRPKKIEVEVPTPKKAAGRGRKASAPVPAASAKKLTARPQTAAPRKRRGYTSFEVADKFAAQVKQFITELQAEDAANAAAAAGEADDEGEDIEIEVELGPEDDIAGPSNGIPTELAEDEEGEEEGDHMLIDSADIAEAAALDQEQLARDVNGSAELATEDNEFDDETELPSETAVLAEIAAVVQEAGTLHPETEHHSSSSNVSVDFHEEVTEVSAIPQIDGSNEVDVFMTHVDAHEHVHEHEHEHIHEHVHAHEPAVATSVGSLFGAL